MKSFETTIVVDENDLDELNHVNNVRYVQWVNDIAKLNWDTIATPSIKENYFWVLITHHIDYKQAALLNDTVTIKTYVAKAQGVTSTRIVEMFNKNTSKLLAKSETIWCLISRKTQKPARITPEINSLFF
ncbi:acyl-CoA thioesterase [Lacinutrix sp. C3R15]|uniref:acyl-CoA thioesterase n=1 Tax=Flavobacteriaceae TaxID=49546 RepID=UPI001C08FC85|nr:MULTISPECIES: thioesterase family protein [Flavobacteriaceae]MBU2938795.1 acyl-CoA thioesterase [Lacinutrix sp. C3R15]MDO6622108.1 thioesterase family protein [Oceanihabitans sp. 1_MG-2023]